MLVCPISMLTSCSKALFSREHTSVGFTVAVVGGRQHALKRAQEAVTLKAYNSVIARKEQHLGLEWAKE